MNKAPTKIPIWAEKKNQKALVGPETVPYASHGKVIQKTKPEKIGKKDVQKIQ